MTELSADEVRARRFDVARKGYDRAAVDAFRESAAAQIEAMEQRFAAIEEMLAQVGIEEPKDLAAEMDAVGSAVTRILQEARTAAEEMRSRAAADAARWRAEAATSSEAVLQDAAAAAEAARRSVWETGTAMLANAVEDATRFSAALSKTRSSSGPKQSVRLCASPVTPGEIGKNSYGRLVKTQSNRSQPLGTRATRCSNRPVSRPRPPRNGPGRSSNDEPS